MAPTTHLPLPTLLPLAILASILLAGALLLPYAAGDEELVQATCRKTAYPDLCVSVLAANSSSKSADTLGLATITGGVLLANTTLAAAYVDHLVSSTPEPVLKDILAHCADDYRAGLGNVRDGLAYLAAWEFRHAGALIESVERMPVICHAQFGRLNATYPPGMAEREEGIVELAAITAGIIQNLNSVT